MIRILITYFTGVIEEFKRVNFPAIGTVSRETVLVIGAIVIAVVLLAGIDFIFTQLLKLIV